MSANPSHPTSEGLGVLELLLPVPAVSAKAGMKLAGVASPLVLRLLGGKTLNMAPKLLGTGIKIGAKIEKQMVKRGWNREAIEKLIANPSATRVVTDTRHLAGGGRMADAATAYINKQGHYVVRNNVTGDIVQVSDRFDLNWVAPW